MPISIRNRQKRFAVDTAGLRRSLARLLKKLELSHAEVSLLLVDDEGIREYNRTYLERDRATNVISFSMRDGMFGDVHPEHLGDIVLSVETAARDAAAAEIDFMDEVEFLIIHGLLHLLGYDHEKGDAEEAEKMKKAERELFLFLRKYPID